uniref:Uncharacterized protein n=1 Tax=Rhizophora mucronata TaxID=61149 RepID=A0A2P2JT45_RHIMU
MGSWEVPKANSHVNGGSPDAFDEVIFKIGICLSHASVTGQVHLLGQGQWNPIRLMASQSAFFAPFDS